MPPPTPDDRSRPHSPRRPVRAAEPARGRTARQQAGTPSSRQTAGRGGRGRDRGRRSARRGEEEAGTARSPRMVLSFGGLTVSVRVLGVVVMAALLAAFMVPTAYQAWRQDQDYRAITARVAAAETRNKEMRTQLELWDDPDYVASQARARLGYVRPGETQYAVTDPGPGHDSDAATQAAAPTGPARPWVQVFTASLAEADSPGK